MTALAVAIGAVASFVLSSVYYSLVTPFEQRALGERALDRGRPGPAKVLAELLRTAVVAAVFAWVAVRTDLLDLPGALLLAVVVWVGFPVALLTGSVTWEKTPTVTAAIHAGDWLLKLLLIGAVLGALH